jgi:hypothetical protein
MPYRMNRTLLTIASPRSGIMVFMQKVTRTVSAAKYPTRSIPGRHCVSCHSNAQVKDRGPLWAAVRSLPAIAAVAAVAANPSIRWPSGGSSSQNDTRTAQGHHRMSDTAIPSSHYAAFFGRWDVFEGLAHHRSLHRFNLPIISPRAISRMCGASQFLHAHRFFYKHTQSKSSARHVPAN